VGARVDVNKLTIKDIAQMANVSYMTVSRALNGERYVKPETLKRILDICEKTGYRPNAIARQLKRQRNDAIGIIVPDISNAFFCEIAKNIEWNARQKGYSVFISSSFYDYGVEERNIQVLLENRVDGIVISGVGDRSPETILPYAQRIPMVFIGDNIPEEGVSHISVDNQLGTAMATEYLLSLGHLRFAFLGGRYTSITHRRRQAGFIDALTSRGIEDHEVFTVCDGSRIEDGYRTGMSFWAKRPSATAILTINDHFAIGIMQAASECGVRIPEDISLIGFDDISFASLPRIQLTTVCQPKEEICEYALNTLIDIIKGGASSCPCKVRPKLIIRATCSNPKA